MIEQHIDQVFADGFATWLNERSDLPVRVAAENAAIILGILDGAKSPRRDVVLLNAAAALVAAGRANRLGDGVPMAAHAIDSGAATQKLTALVAFTQS